MPLVFRAIADIYIYMYIFYLSGWCSCCCCRSGWYSYSAGCFALNDEINNNNEYNNNQCYNRTYDK